MIKYILIFLIIYLVIRFMQFYNRIRNAAQHSNNHNTTSAREEGDVTVTSQTESKGKKISKDDGEYIDYEDA